MRPPTTPPPRSSGAAQGRAAGSPDPGCMRTVRRSRPPLFAIGIAMTMTRVLPRATAATAALSTLFLLQAAVPAHATGKPVVLEGELEVRIEDYPDGRSQTRHFLHTAQGRRELRFSRKPTTLPSGSRIRVRGDADGMVLALNGAEAGNVQALAIAPSLTLGAQRVLVIPVNFQDDTTQPFTVDAMRDAVFGTVDAHFRESSFGQTWLEGDVLPWRTIAMNKTTCDADTLASLADQSAQQAGVNLGAYARKLYVFPRNACSWSGLGNVGGNSTRAWSNGRLTTIVIGHELGHNLGLYHAQALNCDVAPLGNACTTLSYGDTADLMGNYRTAQFNPYEKELLGWLNDGVSPPITTASTSGRYVVEPYTDASTGAKALKIPRGTDGSGRKLWYYVEYRQAVGVDAVLANTGNLVQGVVVRTATEGDPASSRQIDMSPGSATNTYTELADGALAVGQSYTDATAGVSLTLAWTTANGAAIDVLVDGGAPSCVRSAPQVSLSGGGSAVAAGTAVVYGVSVVNRDSAACAATSFNLAGSVPAGWGAQLGTAMVALSPGASANTTLTVASAANAATGSHGIGVGTASSAGAVHTASASATYEVAAAGGTLSNAVGTDKASYRKGETVYLSALVKRDGAVVNGATVTFTVTLPNGNTTQLSATSGADGYARSSYKIGKGKTAAGGYGVRADASQGGGSASASTAFTVN